jgi:hypothetical protein
VNEYGVQRVITVQQLQRRADTPSKALREAEAELLVEVTRRIVRDGKWFTGRPVIELDEHESDWLRNTLTLRVTASAA